MGNEISIIDHGYKLSFLLTDSQSVFLRRSTLISSTDKLHISSRKLSRGKSFAWNTAFGVPILVNEWTAIHQQAKITASLGYLGKVVEIRTSKPTPIFLNINQYLGHYGRMEINTKRISKNEFWFMAEFSGDGGIFLHIPAGYEEISLTGNRLLMDYNYVSAIWGNFEIDGEELDIKSWFKSGETDSVAISGQCDLMLCRALNSSKSNAGLLGSILEIFD